MYYITSGVYAALYAYAFIYFLNIVFTPKENRKFGRILTVLFLSILYYLSSWRWHSGLKLVYMPVLYYAVSSLFYRGGRKAKILFCLFFYILNYGIQLSVEIPLALSKMRVDSLEGIEMAAMLVCLLILFWILTLLKRHMAQKTHILNRIFFRTIGVFLIVWILYIGIILYLMHAVDFHEHLSMLEWILLSAIDLILMFMSIFILFVFVKFEEYYEQIRMYESELQRTTNSAVYYKKLETVNLENQTYIHNIAHYLKAIAGLAKRYDYADIIKIVENLEENVLAISEEIYCGNNIINAIVCEKKGITSEKGIAFKVMIERTINLAFINEIDLIGMLGNLLDNAIEAAEKCSAEKVVTLNAYTSENNRFIIFQVNNSCKKPPCRKNGKYMTTKRDKTKHGFGISYIESIVKNYDGFMNIKYEDNLYSTSLVLTNRVSGD